MIALQQKSYADGMTSLKNEQTLTFNAEEIMARVATKAKCSAILDRSRNKSMSKITWESVRWVIEMNAGAWAVRMPSSGLLRQCLHLLYA